MKITSLFQNKNNLTTIAFCRISNTEAEVRVYDNGDLQSSFYVDGSKTEVDAIEKLSQSSAPDLAPYGYIIVQTLPNAKTIKVEELPSTNY